MTKSYNLAAMLTITGGLAAASLPSAANASCSATAASGGGGSSASASVPSGVGTEQQYDVAIEFRNGIEALAANDYKTAKRSFDHAVSVTPHDSSLLYLAGSARMGLNDWKGARRMLEKSLKYDPKFIRARQDLGVTYAKLGEIAKAQAIMDDLQASEKSCADGCNDAKDLKLAINTLQAAMAGPVALK